MPAPGDRYDGDSSSTENYERSPTGPTEYIECVLEFVESAASPMAAGTAFAHAGAEAVPLIYKIASEEVKGIAGKEADENTVVRQQTTKSITH